ncbi:MAG: helix-turn-helix domain-containing protein, partial [Pseudoclavibacter sp.]
GSAADFRGRVVSRDFGDIHVSHVDADAHRVRRLPSTIRPNDPRLVKFSFQVAGTSVYTQDDRSAEIGSGDLVIYETSRPYAVDEDGPVTSLVVMLPPAALTVSSAQLSMLTATRIAPTSMIGECAQPFMRQFASRLRDLGQVDGERLISAFVGLVDAMLHAELSTLVAGDTTFDRIRWFIERNLGRENLSPALIARENFVSLRSLQYLFQDRGTTVSQWIREARLQRCKLDLADPANGDEAVAAVAARWGLRTAASFNRLFKQQFGQTPGEWRREHLAVLSRAS